MADVCLISQTLGIAPQRRGAPCYPRRLAKRTTSHPTKPRASAQGARNARATPIIRTLHITAAAPCPRVCRIVATIPDSSETIGINRRPISSARVAFALPPVASRLLSAARGTRLSRHSLGSRPTLEDVSPLPPAACLEVPASGELVIPDLALRRNEGQ